MKKYMKFLLLFCFAAVIVCGCSNNEEETETRTISITPYMFDEVEKSDEPCSDEDVAKIQEGINNWAGSFLITSSDVEDEDKEIIDEALYNSIVSDDEREKVQADREELYKDNSEVVVDSVETTVNSAYPATYEGTNMGYVECNVDIKGTKNEEAFERNYTMTLLVSYETNTVSVYEVGEISWE